MKRKKRDSLNILYEMLKIVGEEPLLISNLMFRTQISHRVLMNHTTTLLKYKLIKRTDIISITKRGKLFLKSMEKNKLLLMLMGE